MILPGADDSLYFQKGLICELCVYLCFFYLGDRDQCSWKRWLLWMEGFMALLPSSPALHRLAPPKKISMYFPTRSTQPYWNRMFIMCPPCSQLSCGYGNIPQKFGKKLQKLHLFSSMLLCSFLVYSSSLSWEDNFSEMTGL